MSSKKQQKKRQKEMEELKIKMSKYEEQKKTYLDKYSLLFQFLLKKQLKFSHATVYDKRIHYFRVDQYNKIIEESRAEIDQDDKLAKIVKNATQDLIYYKRPDHINAKYPKHLEVVGVNLPDQKYASFKFDTTPPSKKWLVIVIVFAVLMVVLFPVWPFSVKYGIWLTTYILLIVILVVIAVRLLIYLVCVIVGYQVWFLPNFLNTIVFKDNFVPVFEYSRTEKSWLMIFLRIFAICSIIALALHIYLHPNFLEENIQSAEETLIEAHDWGVNRLQNAGGNFSQRAITNLEIILNETKDIEAEIPSHQSEL